MLTFEVFPCVRCRFNNTVTTEELRSLTMHCLAHGRKSHHQRKVNIGPCIFYRQNRKGLIDDYEIEANAINLDKTSRKIKEIRNWEVENRGKIEIVISHPIKWPQQ